MPHARPNTARTPYTSPTMPINESRPHIATSDVENPSVVVFVCFTVVMKTLAMITTPIVSEMMPVIKFAIGRSPCFGFWKVSFIYFSYFLQNNSFINITIYISIMETKKQVISLYIDPVIVTFIDEQLGKKGKARQRNPFIMEALEYYLRLKYGFKYIRIKKTKFPKAGRPPKHETL